MIKNCFAITLSLLCLIACAQKKKKTDHLVSIYINQDTLYAILYDETPIHKANFIKLANEKFYDSTTFHRVIKGFMIQGGDPNSKDDNTHNDGQGGPGYTQKAEILPQYYHKKGALSAARIGDKQNPERASSGSQFYIVQGKRYDTTELNRIEQQTLYSIKNSSYDVYLQKEENKHLATQLQKFRAEKNRTGFDSLITSLEPIIDSIANAQFKGLSTNQRNDYEKIGGAPHLDGQYTVFGEVIKGLDVIDKIAESKVQHGSNRPLKNIYMRVTIKELPRKKITKLTGYKYTKG